MIPDSSKVRLSISPYRVSTLLPMKPLYSSVQLWFRDLVTFLQDLTTIPLSGPRAYLSIADGQIMLLIYRINLLPFTYPRCTFMATHFRSNGSYTQSILPATVNMINLTV